MQVHRVKTDPDMFQAILEGKKTHDMRFDDRNYKVGDVVIQLETQFSANEMAAGKPLVFTGSKLEVKVTYILRGPVFGLMPGWIDMSICVQPDEELLFGPHAGKRRADQLGINCRWLIEQIDQIHNDLCPGQTGTWQERARQAVEAANCPKSSRATSRQSIIEAINCEPEYPETMPDEMWEAIRGDRDAITEALRITVQLTKKGIRERFEAMEESAIQNQCSDPLGLHEPLTPEALALVAEICRPPGTSGNLHEYVSSADLKEFVWIWNSLETSWVRTTRYAAQALQENWPKRYSCIRTDREITMPGNDDSDAQRKKSHDVQDILASKNSLATALREAETWACCGEPERRIRAEFRVKELEAALAATLNTTYEERKVIIDRVLGG